MKGYDVEVERGARFWLIHVPEIARSTQARTLREAERMARDLIAVMTDQQPDAFGVDLSYSLPDEAAKHLDEMQRLRDAASEMTARANRHQADAARALVDRGLPLRDVGMLLGLSHQRVHQLVST